MANMWDPAPEKRPSEMTDVDRANKIRRLLYGEACACRQLLREHTLQRPNLIGLQELLGDDKTAIVAQLEAEGLGTTVVNVLSSFASMANDANVLPPEESVVTPPITSEDLA